MRRERFISSQGTLHRLTTVFNQDPASSLITRPTSLPRSPLKPPLAPRALPIIHTIKKSPLSLAPLSRRPLRHNSPESASEIHNIWSQIPVHTLAITRSVARINSDRDTSRRRNRHRLIDDALHFLTVFLAGAELLLFLEAGIRRVRFDDEGVGVVICGFFLLEEGMKRGLWSWHTGFEGQGHECSVVGANESFQDAAH